MKWFERSFPSDLPVWLYPNIVERLRGTPARLEEKLQAVSKELLIKRDGDKWSIQENAGHLLDLEPLWDGRLDDFLAHEETFRATDLTNRKTFEANHNVKPIDGILKSFRLARQSFVQRLDVLDEALITLISHHPRLKTPMRVIDFIFFVAEHDDHHLTQMTKLLRLHSIS